MPVYEYECTACGYQFEEFQKISDKPIRTCPSCKKKKVRKLISQSTFVLKGSGWYATDYGKGNSGGSTGKSKKKSKESSSDDKSSSKDSKSDSSQATVSA